MTNDHAGEVIGQSPAADRRPRHHHLPAPEPVLRVRHVADRVIRVPRPSGLRTSQRRQLLGARPLYYVPGSSRVTMVRWVTLLARQESGRDYAHLSVIALLRGSTCRSVWPPSTRRPSARWTFTRSPKRSIDGSLHVVDGPAPRARVRRAHLHRPGRGRHRLLTNHWATHAARCRRCFAIVDELPLTTSEQCAAAALIRDFSAPIYWSLFVLTSAPERRSARSFRICRGTEHGCRD
jgi:hypothetical protein